VHSCYLNDICFLCASNVFVYSVYFFVHSAWFSYALILCTLLGLGLALQFGQLEKQGAGNGTGTGTGTGAGAGP